MGPERGMTVAELIEELRGLPPQREVRFMLADNTEEPLAREDIKASSSGPFGKILLKPTKAVAKSEEDEDDRCSHANRCMHFDEA